MLITLTFGDEQVIDKLQSSAKAEKLCWASELPREGLGAQVLEQIRRLNQETSIGSPAALEQCRYLPHRYLLMSLIFLYSIHIWMGSPTE
jgi:hypothetical protein